MLAGTVLKECRQCCVRSMVTLCHQGVLARLCQLMQTVAADKLLCVKDIPISLFICNILYCE